MRKNEEELLVFHVERNAKLKNFVEKM